MLVDSHCHIDFSDFHHDRATALHQAASVGVKQIVVPGITSRYWPRVLSLTGEFCGVKLYPALGLHPFFLTEHKKADLKLLDQYLKRYQGQVRAVGEIGLDFARKTDKGAQLSYFEAQLDLAEKYQLPVILHVVKAHEQVLDILKDRPEITGIVHSYSGSEAQAKRYIKQGFLLGVGGVITWPKSDKKRAMFAKLPLESLVLETDSPDMPPANIKGERNTPEQVATVLEALAAVRSESEDEIAKTTTDNVNQLLGLGQVCLL